MKGFSLRNFFSNNVNNSNNSNNTNSNEVNLINNKNNLITTTADNNLNIPEGHSTNPTAIPTNASPISTNNLNDSSDSINSLNSSSSPSNSKSPPLSILKKRIASSGEAVELTLGSSYTNLSWSSPQSSPESSPPASAPCSPSQKRKSAQFKDNVDIMYFSKEDSANNASKGKREQEKLKEVSTKKSKHTSVHHLIKCPLHDQHCNESLLGNFTDVQGNIITNEPLLPGKQIEIINDNDNLRWKISVPIGSGFIRNRTNVKAMTGGKKLIITGFKPAMTDSGEEYMHQYNDKLSLPHSIDAFAVKATMSREGTLKISAPIISTSTTTLPSPSLSKAVVT